MPQRVFHLTLQFSLLFLVIITAIHCSIRKVYIRRMLGGIIFIIEYMCNTLANEVLLIANVANTCITGSQTLTSVIWKLMFIFNAMFTICMRVIGYISNKTVLSATFFYRIKIKTDNVFRAFLVAV